MLYNYYLTQFSISAIIKKIFGRRPYTLQRIIQSKCEHDKNIYYCVNNSWICIKI